MSTLDQRQVADGRDTVHRLQTRLSNVVSNILRTLKSTDAIVLGTRTSS